MRPLLHHNSHRILLAPPPEPAHLPSHHDKTLSIVFAGVFCVTMAYLILDSFRQCIRRCRQRRQRQQQPLDHNATEDLEQDPECLVQLQAIPVLVHSPPPSPSCSKGFESCPVCLAEYEEGEEVRVLPRCKHMFHRVCIDRWLITRSSFCPICRDRVIERSVEPAMNSCSNNNNSNNNNNNRNRVGGTGRLANITVSHQQHRALL